MGAIKLKKNKLNIAFQADAPVDEVIDSIADALRAGAIIEDVLEDGFKFTEVFDILKVQPIVNEIVDDIPVFLDQFTKLNGETAVYAIGKAKEIVEDELGTVSGIVLAFLERLAHSFAFVERTILEGEKQINAYKQLFAGLKSKSDS